MIETSSMLAMELQSRLPLKVARANRGVGSFITLDLADAAADIVSRVWVYLCDWVIFQGDAPILTSSHHGREGAPLPFFLNSSLRAIELDANTRTVALLFDADLRLELIPNLAVYEPSDNLVMFFRFSRRVLAFSYQNGFHETD